MPAAPRILVVDDDESVREPLVRVLREAGYEVCAVEDMPGGLYAAQAAGHVNARVCPRPPGRRATGRRRRFLSRNPHDASPPVG